MIIAAIVVAIVVLGALALWLSNSGSSAPSAAASVPHAETVHRWPVTVVTKETPSTVSFEVSASMSFMPGQFVMVRPTAELPWRAYSFSRAPGEPLRLTVKHVPGGQTSAHIAQKLEVGQTVEVKGPYGHFVLPPEAKRVVMLAGGSGVTPMVSMLRALAAKGWPASVTLIDGNRSGAEIILKAELDQLEASSGGKLVVQHVLDAGGVPQGPLTKEVLSELLSKLERPDVVALCGPTPMMEAAHVALKAAWPEVKVLEEKFSGDVTVAAGAATHTATLVQGGKSRPFTVREGEPVLQAARKAKVSLQAGCEMGACGTCRVKVVSGGIEVPADACLSDEEREQGYALVCVGKLKGDAAFEPAP